MITVAHTRYESSIWCPHCGEYYSNKEFVENGYLDTPDIISEVDCKKCRKVFAIQNNSTLIVKFEILTPPKEQSMPWTLYYLDEYHKPILIGTCKSGDSAKQKARRYQIGLGYTPYFEINDPHGNLWASGSAKLTPNGFKMQWHYPK